MQGDSFRNDVTFIKNKYALKEEHLFKTCLFWYLKKQEWTKEQEVGEININLSRALKSG